MPAVSPALTRLQYSASNCAGCSRKACDRLEPASTRPLISIISRAKRGLRWPRATISNACSSGTPAFSIVASWRVKNVMSFSLTLPPPRKVCRLSFLMRMPCRRKLEVTTVSDAALISPRTLRLLRSMPSQRYVYSLTRVSLRCAIAVAIVVTSGGYSLVIASISSREVTACLTFSKPDWRRFFTPSFCDWSAMSSALALRMISWRISSEIGITS